MKKLLFVTLLLVFTSGLFAQDTKEIRKSIDKNDVATAKTQVDAFMAKNPDNAEGYYLKSKIYGMLASNDQLKNTVPDARLIAFDAFQKAMANDKSNLLLVDLTKDQYKPIFNLYTGFYDQGAAYFNQGAASGSKADFEQAMNAFSNSNKVGHYIYSKKWALSDIDTALVLNIGKAALNAGRKEEALQYFKQLADANIRGTKESSVGYDLPYQWLTEYYKSAKDDANMVKYSTLGKQYFPKDDYYDAILLDSYREKKDHDALFKKYVEVVNRYPDSLTYHFNYANDAFNYIYNSDAGVTINNREELLKAINTELGKASTINPNDVNTNWLYGQYFYNSALDLREKVKGKADPAVIAQSKEMFTKAIPYTQKALTTLEVNYKKSDKSKYKSIADLMQRIYQGLGQPDKVKLYQAKYDTADTKFIN